MGQKPSQAELVKSLSNRDLIFNLYLTQGILLVIAVAGVYFLFEKASGLWQYFQWEPVEILLYGGLTGLFVVLVDFSLMHWLPRAMYDDGGINERIFSILSTPHIFIVTGIIAVVEEVLFRGVLQTSFGIVIASIVFALIHIRYLHKKLLIVVTLGLSFLLGLLFWFTKNLFVCIFAHFLIDFVLGIYIRHRANISRDTEEYGE